MWIYDSIMALASGENVEHVDSMAADILEIIWRDCIQMENRNTKMDEMKIGYIVRQNKNTFPGHPEPEVKGKEVKGKEVKGKEVYGEFVKLTLKENEKLKEKFGEKKYKWCLDKLDKYLPNGKKYKSHYHVLIGWVSEAYDEKFKDEIEKKRRRDIEKALLKS